VYRSAYDTTACKGYQIDKTVNDIAADYAGGNHDYFHLLHTLDCDGKRGEIYGLFHPESRVKPFSHPIRSYDSKSNRTQGTEVVRLFVDLRTSTRPNRIVDGNNPYAITDNGEFTFQVARAKLELYWTIHGELSLSAFAEYPGKIFSTWISETLARNLGLSLESQIAVRAISADHFLNMFEPMESSFHDDNVSDHKRIKRIAEISDLPTEHIIRYISTYVSPSKNVGELVEHMTGSTGGDRLSDLTGPALVGIIAHSWRGTMGTETVAVSLEHPPTFMAMIYTALSELAVKNTNLAKIALMKAKDSSSDAFLRGLSRIFNQAED
jgi:hypothetical protein